LGFKYWCIVCNCNLFYFGYRDFNGGWASNNKYSMLGAMRSGAQIVSYELSAGLSIISIVVLTGSLQISEIIESQRNGWWLFKGHIPAIIAFVIFIIAVTAETNRAPLIWRKQNQN
jgi:NADH-quinone oxidoreductase subunit H